MSNYGRGTYGSGYDGEEHHGRRHDRHEQGGYGFGSRPEPEEVTFGSSDQRPQGGYGGKYGGEGGYESRPEAGDAKYGGGYGAAPEGGYGSRPDVGGGPYGGYEHQNAYGRPPTEGAYGHRPQGGDYDGRHEPSQGHGRPQKNASSLELEGEPMKIFCAANPDYCLTIRDDTVILAPADGSESQKFYKDCKWGSRVQDESGQAAFAIVNKSSGMALKHGNEINEKVTLGPYDGETMDEFFLWTQSNDVGDGYQCLRPVGNIRLNLDALHGNGTIRTGTELILFKWNKQENQKWKITPIGGGYPRPGGGYPRPSYGDY